MILLILLVTFKFFCAEQFIVEHRISTYLCSIVTHQKVGWRIVSRCKWSTLSLCSYLLLKEVHFLKTWHVRFPLGKDLVKTGNWHWTEGELSSSLIRYSEPQSMVVVSKWMCLCSSRHLPEGLSLSHCYVSCHWLLWKGKPLLFHYKLIGLPAPLVLSS